MRERKKAIEMGWGEEKEERRMKKLILFFCGSDILLCLSPLPAWLLSRALTSQRQGLRFCISNRLPGEASAVGPQPTL